VFVGCDFGSCAAPSAYKTKVATCYCCNFPWSSHGNCRTQSHFLFTMFARRVLCQLPRAVVAGASRAAGPAAALRKVRWPSHHYRVQASSHLSVELCVCVCVCVCVCNHCGCGRPSCGPCCRQLGSGECLQVPSVHGRVMPSAPSFHQPDLVLCTSCVARCISATRRVVWLQARNVNHA
jgi:hypothetical protein